MRPARAAGPHPLLHALAADPATPAVAVAATIRAAGPHLGAEPHTDRHLSLTAELATHPHRPATPHPVLDLELGDPRTLHHALTRAGVDDTHRARACALAGPETVLEYLDHYPDAHPYAVALAGDRDPLTLQAARILAVHPAAPAAEQVRALTRALGAPEPARTRAQRLITTATCHPDQLPALSQVAVDPFRAPLAHYATQPDPYRSRVADLTRAARAQRSRPAAWAAAISACGDNDVAEAALAEHGATPTAAQPLVRAILTTPALHGTRAYTRAKLLTIRYAHLHPDAREPVIPPYADDTLIAEAASIVASWTNLEDLPLRPDLSLTALRSVWHAAVRVTDVADPAWSARRSGTPGARSCEATAVIVLAHPAADDALRRDAHRTLTAEDPAARPNGPRRQAPGLADLLLELSTRPRDQVGAQVPVTELTRHTDHRVRTALGALALTAIPRSVLDDPGAVATMLSLLDGFTGTVADLVHSSVAVAAA